MMLEPFKKSGTPLTGALCEVAGTDSEGDSLVQE